LAGDVTLDAGPDRTVALLQEVALAGEFSDWRPQSRQALATSWSLVTGPGNVQFADRANPVTTATFSTPGAYVLRLTAQGSDLAVSDDVSITVSDAAYLHEARFRSGNGALSDPLNRYFSGGLWKPANLTGADVYALIPGTSYIVGDFIQFGSSHVRVLFDLPAGFAQPSLSFQYYADNAARFHLNGTVIAEQPFDSEVARYVGAPATGSDAVASHFQAGVNTLDIETYNTFGPLAVDYEALLRYVAPPGGNLPPVINAGADRELGAPGQIVLAATVSDDARPFPEFFSFEWIHSHGPAAVAFSDRRSLQPTVTFSAPGEYVLLFKANDGELSATDSLTVTVRAGAAGNLPPLVDAGPPRSGVLLQVIHLAGTVSDDHTAAADLHIQWRKVSGPGAVAFAAVGSAETDAAFSAPGSYVLALGADDGQFAVTDTTTVEVASQPVSNAPPTANAGPDRSVASQAGYVQLQGSTTDDGLPAGLSPSVAGVGECAR
jgi:PKD repeat protein